MPVRHTVYADRPATLGQPMTLGPLPTSTNGSPTKLPDPSDASSPRPDSRCPKGSTSPGFVGTVHGRRCRAVATGQHSADVVNS